MPATPEELVEELRARGLRITGPRLAVYRAVAELPGHPEVVAIAERARQNLGSVSTQAVYDGLSVLTEAGLLRRIEPAGSPARYETRVADNHHHAVCRVCGTSRDIDCTIGAAPCLTVHDSGGFEIDEAEITFWGLCEDCAAKNGRIGTDPSGRQNNHKRRVI